MANKDTKQPIEAPKLPGLNFGKRPSMFSGNKGIAINMAPKTRFIAPQIRINQNKGGGGK